ncbi:MAG: DUF2147 domain-containing protein [Myxococcota bacterium]
MTFVWIWLASTAWADAIEGRYWNPDRTRQIEVTIEQGVLSGTVVWVKTPQQTDEIGTQIIRDFERAGERWKGGTVVSPLNGRVYSGVIWIDEGDLMMRGYVGVSFLGRTARLDRVEPEATPEDSHRKP